MSMCRRFHGEAVVRLIVSVPTNVVVQIDCLMKWVRHPARGCRAEFVRLALAEKLARDLMIYRHHGDGATAPGEAKP